MPIFEPITLAQLPLLLAEIHQHHKIPLQGRKIKYVDLKFDNRDAFVFTITFKRIGGDEEGKTFTVCNRYPDDVRLFDEVMAWLVSGRKEYQPFETPQPMPIPEEYENL